MRAAKEKLQRLKPRLGIDVMQTSCVPPNRPCIVCKVCVAHSLAKEEPRSHVSLLLTRPAIGVLGAPAGGSCGADPGQRPAGLRPGESSPRCVLPSLCYQCPDRRLATKTENASSFVMGLKCT